MGISYSRRVPMRGFMRYECLPVTSTKGPRGHNDRHDQSTILRESVEPKDVEIQSGSPDLRSLDSYIQMLALASRSGDLFLALWRLMHEFASLMRRQTFVTI